MKRAASFLLAAMLTCSGCAAWMPEAVSVSVSAADSSVTFDEATGTLTLSGNVEKDAVRAYAKNDAVKAVTAAPGTVLPENCSELFKIFRAESIDLSNADTSNVTNMREMFYYCFALTTLDVTGFDTSNVAYMNQMFQNCEALTELDVSGFDTSNVTDMNQMFLGCSALQTIYGPAEFSTAALNLGCDGSMFSGCENLIGGNA